MEIDKNSFKKFYDLVKKFIAAVDTNNLDVLKKEFNVIDENIEYIYKILDNYYDKNPKIDILSFEEAFLDAIEDQRNFDFFKFNDVECWGINCNILANGKIDEPIFHFRICKNDREYNLEFLYIGS